MFTTDLMLDEHKNILRFCDAITNACTGLVAGNKPEIVDFRDGIRFVREYADQYHHAKEEKILFVEMTAHLGEVAERMIKFGMLAEHNIARFYIASLEEALNEYEKTESDSSKMWIIVNAMSYVSLLRRHIDRENAAVYPLAEKSLSQDILESIEERTRAFEQELEADQAIDKLLAIVNRLEAKYEI